MSPLAQRIAAGDARALARGLSLVESRLPGSDALLAELYDASRPGLRVGVTGPPGAGKSTLVDCIATHLRSEDATVAILAVDPSSPFSGGAVLGDRVRMLRHHEDGGVYIRSMAARGQVGGLAPAVADALTVLEAAGHDAVLIETAGVGQSEVDIVQVAGSVAVVLTPALGDDIQAAKAGIMEIADLFVLNKADLQGADEMERQILAATMLNPPGQPRPPVLRTVALRCEGVPEVVRVLREARPPRAGSGYWRRRILDRVGAELGAMLASDAVFGKELDGAAEGVAAGRVNPHEFIRGTLERLRREWGR